MDYYLRIKEAKKQTIFVDGSRFLDVYVEVLEKKVVRGQEKEVVVEERHFGYPVDTTETEVNADLEKFLLTYHLEKQNEIDEIPRKEAEEVEAAADETIINLPGTEITYAKASKSKGKLTS